MGDGRWSCWAWHVLGPATIHAGREGQHSVKCYAECCAWLGFGKLEAFGQHHPVHILDRVSRPMFSEQAHEGFRRV
jgi:hypothetical protein